MKKRSNYPAAPSGHHLPAAVPARWALPPQRKFLAMAETAETGSHCPRTGVWATTTGARRSIYRGEIMPPAFNQAVQWSLDTPGPAREHDRD